MITISAVCSYDTLTLEAIDSQLDMLRQNFIKPDRLFFSGRGICDFTAIASPYMMQPTVSQYRGMHVATLRSLPDHMFVIGSPTAEYRSGLEHWRQLRIEDYREWSRARDWEAIAEALRNHNAKNKRSMWCISELLKSLEATYYKEHVENDQ